MYLHQHFQVFAVGPLHSSPWPCSLLFALWMFTRVLTTVTLAAFCSCRNSLFYTRTTSCLGNRRCTDYQGGFDCPDVAEVQVDPELLQTVAGMNLSGISESSPRLSWSKLWSVSFTAETSDFDLRGKLCSPSAVPTLHFCMSLGCNSSVLQGSVTICPVSFHTKVTLCHHGKRQSGSLTDWFVWHWGPGCTCLGGSEI